MKTRYKTPFKRKIFHTKQKIDTKDSTFLKKRIDLIINKKSIRKERSETLIEKK